jgi:hypothetical protein
MSPAHCRQSNLLSHRHDSVPLSGGQLGGRPLFLAKTFDFFSIMELNIPHDLR